MIEEKQPHPANRKAYDGSIVVNHPVKNGETLQSIANVYCFANWKPIWIFNSQVEQTISNDPNIIRAGVTIFIPRNAANYDKVIRKLKVLSIQIAGEADALIYGLEAEKYKLEATKVVVNFAADIATLLVGLALKARQAHKAASVANKTKGQAKIAANLASRADTREFAEKFAAVRNRLTKTALSSHLSANSASVEVTKYTRGKAVDAATKLGDQAVSDFTGHNTNTLQHSKNTYRFGQILAGTALTAAKVLDTADILLDYIEPATVAEGMMWLMTGETSSMSFERATETIKSTTSLSVASLDSRIATLTEERKLLYG